MTILIRCDATAQTGLGHLSRCLALAEALQALGERCRFLGHVDDPAVAMISAAGFDVSRATHATGSADDASETIARATALDAHVVADSYAITPRWTTLLRHAQRAPVLLDDFARLPDYGSCAGVLNFTVGASNLSYRHLAPARVASGPRVLLVRRAIMELRTAHVARESTIPPSRILLTLGGSDVRGLTLPLARAVRAVAPAAELRVVHRDGPALARDTDLDPSLFVPQSPNLAVHYAWADCCIAGGGLTKYECAYLGTRVGIVSQTDDQQQETSTFCALGLATDLAAAGDGRSWEERLHGFLTDPAGPTLARAARSAFPADAPLAAARFVRDALHAARSPALERLPA